MPRLIVYLVLCVALTSELAAQESGRPLFCYQAPAGWQRANSAGLPTALFEVRDGLDRGIISVTALPRDGGGVIANMKRWRTRLGLKPIPDDELLKSLSPIMIDGLKGDYADLLGPRLPDGTRERLLAVIVRAKDDTWFFVFGGSGPLVGKQKDAFEKFLTSVKLTSPKLDAKAIARLKKAGVDYEVDGRGEVVIINSLGREVNEAALAVLADLPAIEEIWLDRSKVGNDTLENLADHKRLRRLGLNRTDVTDPGLKVLRGLTTLEAIGLTDTRITDTGVAHLAGLKKLFGLDISGTSVTDAGLQSIARLTALNQLGLDRTKVSDAGLKRLATLKDLEELNLAATRVTGSGLIHLQSLPKLKLLRLETAALTDAGLEPLPKLAALEVLTIAGTSIGDAALVHVKGMPKLHSLDLSRTKVTDAGLVHLAGMKQLRHVEILGTDITSAGATKLVTALPNVRIAPWPKDEKK